MIFFTTFVIINVGLVSYFKFDNFSNDTRATKSTRVDYEIAVNTPGLSEEMTNASNYNLMEHAKIQGYSESLNSLSKLDFEIKNKDRSRDDRLDSLNKYIDELVVFLGIDETIFLTDEQLSDIFKEQNLKFAYKKFGNYSIRLVEYNAPYGLFGTLNGTWIIIQFYDGENVISQVLVEDNCEHINDFTIYEEQDKIRLLTVGYASVYTPNPMLVELWELQNNSWEAVDLKLLNNNIPGITVQVNNIIIEDYRNNNSIKIDDIKKIIEFYIGIEKFIIKFVGNTVILEPM